MNYLEEDEISRLPYKYRPLTMWSIMGWNILFGIPLLGFFLALVFSLIRENMNRRSLARYWLFLKLLFVILVGAAVAVLYATGYMETVIQYVQDFFAQLQQPQ